MISKLIETQPTKPRPAAAEEPVLRAPKRPAPKHRVWPSLLVLAVLGGGGYFAYPWVVSILPKTGAPPKAKGPRGPVTVVTADAKQGDMDLYLNGLGTVTAFNTVTIRSRVDGELMKVDFTEGQMIEQGKLLAEIDARPYQVQLADAKAALARDQATLKNAELVLARDKSLLNIHEISDQEWDAQVATVKQYRAVAESDQAKIDNVKLQLVYCRITSPITGRIGLRTVGGDQGNLIRANDPVGLAVVTQLQPISLVFTIPQDDIDRVQKRVGKGQRMVVEAYDRDFQTRLGTGTLMAIDNQVDPSTGTVRLKAEFKNEDNSLFPNQFVNARLLVETRHDATIVPAAAVQRGPNSTFVYVVKPDETVELRTVQVGPTGDGDQLAIETGVSPGEVVVTGGVDKLQPGAKIASRGKNPAKLRTTAGPADATPVLDKTHAGSTEHAGHGDTTVAKRPT